MGKSTRGRVPASPHSHSAPQAEGRADASNDDVDGEDASPDAAAGETTAPTQTAPKAAPATPAPAQTTPAPAQTTPAPAQATATQPAKRGSLAEFVSANTNVVSSFVIGIAGLAVTSTYQCNQGELQKRQAEAQMKIAREQADNSWRIERAKILSENLKTLTARGGDTVEQRYGVLLSLLRGSILEPDVAVSYALELGRDNPEYMRSVLTNIDRKDEQYYRRLEAAYVVTCEQRYGVSSQAVVQCATDKMAERSAALALTLMDNLEDPTVLDSTSSPLKLLDDERSVYANLFRWVGLLSPYLQDLYERRLWEQIDKVMAKSPGSKLVTTLALSLASSEMTAETDTEKALRARLQGLVEGYLAGNNACDAECRVRVFTFVVSNLGKSRGMFGRALRALLQGPRATVEPLVMRLSTRLQYCQHDPADGPLLRDSVLVPTVAAELAQPKPDWTKVDELMGLVALLPEPSAPTETWTKLMEQLTKLSGGRYPKLVVDKRAEVTKLRRANVQPLGPVRSLQASKKRPSFCVGTEEESSDDEEEQ